MIKTVPYAISTESEFFVGGKAMRHNAETFYALADHYASGDETERILARKFQKIAHTMEKRRRETALREVRQYAEIRRQCGYSLAHFSRKRIHSIRVMNAVARVAEVQTSFRKGRVSAKLVKKATRYGRTWLKKAMVYPL